MFSFCADPESLSTFRWFACYFTTGVHMNLYTSLGTVLLLLAIGVSFMVAAMLREESEPQIPAGDPTGWSEPADRTKRTEWE